MKINNNKVNFTVKNQSYDWFFYFYPKKIKLCQIMLMIRSC